jgi:lipopolysaccharide biosynthesis protein
MNRAVILAHYDPDGIVDPYVIRALQCYREIADRLVLVSASASSLPASLADVVDDFLPRANVGYDFCSWRDGLARLGDPRQFDEIICANDSVYGPLFDLENVMSDPRVAAADFWGMVMSAQRGDHVQSWFFAMRRPVIESTAFREFWESVEPQPSKEQVIDHYEVGLTAAFAAAGFRVASIYDGRQCGPPTLREMLRNVSPLEVQRFGRHARRVKRMGPPYNPSELFWERACDAGVPYLKAAIFRANPYRVDVDRTLARAANRWPEWAECIHNHVTRVGLAAES